MSTQAASQQHEQQPNASILDGIIAQTRLTPQDDGYSVARRGVAAFIEELLKPQNQGEPVKKALVDRMIAEIDARLSQQMDEIVHHPDFQSLESAWRGLQVLVERTNFRENIKIEILNVSRADLLDDFEDSPEVMQSGLYKHIYTAEYGQFGGEPVGAIIANYYLSPSSPDIKLMQYVSSVACMAHAPFIASAGPQFFGLESFTGMPNLKDLKDHFGGPQFAKWQSFRESEDARYMALTVPRFLLRTPYDPLENPVKTFVYKETVANSHEHYLWGNTAYAFASRLADSFAKFRWCPNIIGPQSGGAVEDLPLHHFESMGEIETKIPTEVLVSDRREYELAEEGFISLTMRKGSDNAAFFSASSAQKAKLFGASEEGKRAELNYKLGTQLPYMMIVNRLAHYLKVLQREQLGSWKERTDLEIELNKWIRQYVADQENPGAEVRGRRPLRAAQIIVSDVDGEPGWYRVNLNVRPHFKYMGADFTLSLVGKLDKE
ncbi:type VI secretion system contractile sheath large subunit [Pseudomonas lundensis]|jgi:type VI secretion system protein ImpC|uniref:Type VI secretion protein, EvpB/VC_A0108 family n=1 Tax=Pseudomonas lundensis TaxID=86185 RepID=A0AAP8D8S5_9PSED|nr:MULTISPECIES: type VI secretion system contractile sheath large subunit [Pseudomonas]MCT8953493.1 type VI secretion system contractile sheath large subunit [Pseudomonas lundensis]NMZ96771.1 type VI secretion system contractile sheath large subunit [Pseudomonas lundensis]NNA07483.1 type VI secretion system contractile sheath large subunit [Pseudomonas lundensis]NNA14772.1 type VI secretion system contractile sheath large subunit [Pseudomonas lundensis]OZY51588.1 type VI secretion protein [Ps